jgi:hypothetical protein
MKLVCVELQFICVLDMPVIKLLVNDTIEYMFRLIPLPELPANQHDVAPAKA